MTTLTRRTVLAAALVLVPLSAVAQGWPPTRYWSEGGTTFFDSRAVVRDAALTERLGAWPLPAYCLPDGGRLTAADLAARYPACRGE